MIIHSIVELIKKILLYKMSHFPEPCNYNKKEIKVEQDLSNYAAKSDLENATDVDTSDFAKSVDLSSLKSEVDKFCTDELENVPNGLNSS